MLLKLNGYIRSRIQTVEPFKQNAFILIFIYMERQSAQHEIQVRKWLKNVGILTTIKYLAYQLRC